MLNENGKRSGTEPKGSGFGDPGVVLEKSEPLLGEGGGGRARATDLELGEMGAFGGNDVENGALQVDDEAGCISAVPLESDGLCIGRVDLFKAEGGKDGVPGLVDESAGDNVLKVKMR